MTAAAYADRYRRVFGFPAGGGEAVAARMPDDGTYPERADAAAFLTDKTDINR